MAELLDLLQYPFMHRALLAGCVVAATCSALGVFLVLRRLSLIGDGLAHVSLGTVGLGIFLGWSPLVVSVPLVVLGSLAIMWLNTRTSLYGDAAIGVLSAIGIATGVTLASLGGGYNVDLFSYLFGSILAIRPIEVWLTVALSAVVLAIIVLNYRELVAVTFDSDHAQLLGLRVQSLDRMLIVCTAMTVVLGIKVVGTMLVSSLIILPAITALQLARSFQGVLLCATTLAVASVLGGILISFRFDLPTGSTIVHLNALLFLAALLRSQLRKS